MSLDPHTHMQLCTSAGTVQVIGTARNYSYTYVLLSFRISSVEQNVIGMCVVSYIFVIITVNTPRVAVDDVLIMHAGCWGTEWGLGTP